MSIDNLNLRSLDEAGPDTLIQLLYRSVSVAGVASAMQMSDILATARERNRVLGVTGALTSINGDFLQVIEGSRDSIDTLLVSLKRDPRHRDFVILERRIISERAFGDWAMVSPKLIGLDIAQLALLLSVDARELDQYIPFLLEAIRRQESVIEAVGSMDRAKSRTVATPRKSDADGVSGPEDSRA